MGGGVDANRLLAYFGVDHRVDLLPDMNGLPRMYLVRTHALHRHVSAADFGDDVARGIIEPSRIADLPAGVGVERCVVEDDLAFLVRAQLFDALSVMDDGEHFTIARLCLAVAFEDCFVQLA